MSNSHDEIKRLVEASRKMLSNNTINEDINRIRQKHGIINEQVDLTDNNVTSKLNVTKNVEDKIEDETNSPDDKSQGYRVVGGIIVLHGKDNNELDLTVRIKVSLQTRVIKTLYSLFPTLAIESILPTLIFKLSFTNEFDKNSFDSMVYVAFKSVILVFLIVIVGSLVSL